MHPRKIVVALGLCAAAGMSPAQQPQPGLQRTTQDLEAAIFTVQRERAALLDAQFQDALLSVKQKEDTLQKLSTALNAATALRATLPAAAPAETPTPAGNQKTALELAARNLVPYGLNLPFATLGQLNTTMQNLRVYIDNASHSLQMDQLRLQNLSNKRNEGSLPIIADEAKKVQASRPDLSKMR